MIATIESAAYVGVGAYGVSIEVDVADGLPQFTVVGLPDVSIKESRERVRAAIKNSGLRFPPKRSRSTWLRPTFEKRGRHLICRSP